MVVVHEAVRGEAWPMSIEHGAWGVSVEDTYPTYHFESFEVYITKSL